MELPGDGESSLGLTRLVITVATVLSLGPNMTCIFCDGTGKTNPNCLIGHLNFALPNTAQYVFLKFIYYKT